MAQERRREVQVALLARQLQERAVVGRRVWVCLEQCQEGRPVPSVCHVRLEAARQERGRRRALEGKP